VVHLNGHQAAPRRSLSARTYNLRLLDRIEPSECFCFRPIEHPPLVTQVTIFTPIPGLRLTTGEIKGFLEVIQEDFPPADCMSLGFSVSPEPGAD